MMEDFEQLKEVIERVKTISEEVQAMFGEDYRQMLNISQK